MLVLEVGNYDEISDIVGKGKVLVFTAFFAVNSDFFAAWC
jgi:hypothetical protein